jgi:large subunit ribosomal protein L29
MDLKEMRELPNEELHSEIEKAREKVFKMRFQGKGKDIENLGEYKALRKAIARLHTVLRERGKSALERRSTAPGLSHGTARGSSHGATRGAGGEP